MRTWAKVISAEGEYAVVEIKKTSACTGDCDSCGSCEKQRLVKARVINKCGALPGENVYISLSSGKAFFLAALSYILPIVIFFIFAAISENEIVAAAALPISFLLCSVVADFISKTKRFMSVTERINDADF